MKTGELADIGLIMPRSLKTPASLIAVRPLDPSDAQGLTIRYAATSSPGGTMIGSATGWKPKAWSLHPLAGFVIPTNARGEVMIGASASKPGVYFLHGFVVDYNLGGTRYSAPMHYGLEVCAAVRHCP